MSGKLEFVFCAGGTMGPKYNVTVDGECVGYFYPDARNGFDVDDFTDTLSALYSTFPTKPLS
jgi:hypothetical protein